jgi:hypothetical protein
VGHREAADAAIEYTYWVFRFIVQGRSNEASKKIKKP